VELRWYDTTAAMSAEQFQDWPDVRPVTSSVSARPRVLVDGTRFMMDPANLNNASHDANKAHRKAAPNSGFSVNATVGRYLPPAPAADTSIVTANNRSIARLTGYRSRLPSRPRPWRRVLHCLRLARSSSAPAQVRQQSCPV
jgi:hypothetical protein